MLEKSMKSKSFFDEESAIKPMTSKQTTCCGREILLLSLAIISMTVIVFILHENMEEDWTINAESRTRVMILALILFVISILVCYYTINRLGVKTCDPLRNQGNLSYSSSHINLLSCDLPPSYDSIKFSIQFLPPPSYNEINLQITPVGMLETAHDKATG